MPSCRINGTKVNVSMETAFLTERNGRQPTNLNAPHHSGQ
jgi:hypothetical protein